MTAQRDRGASEHRLVLPVARQTRFILVRPHYPENVGAAARSLKTMGLSRLCLVRPGRIGQPDHPMALKMAVKSQDVLGSALVFASLAEALIGVDYAVATSAKSGLGGVYTLQEAAAELTRRSADQQQLAVVFGNEKSGLSDADVALCDSCLRIPMAAAQPSINLAQACQLVAYQLFIAGLAERGP